MLINSYKLKIKEFLHNKPTMFFSFMLPLIMATLFSITISNLDNTESFKAIPIAVESVEVSKNLEEIKSPSKEPLFKIIDSKNYKEDLKSNNIKAYISGYENLKVTVEEKSLNSSLIYEIVNNYNHISEMHGKVMSNDLSIDINRVQETYNKDNNIKSEFDSSSKNFSMTFFIALLAMTCLSASNQGIDIGEVINKKSDMESTKRVLISPVSKFNLIIGQFLAALTFSLLVSTATVLFYLLLGVPIKDYLPKIVLTMTLGTVVGLLQGILISTLLNVKLATKFSINASIYVFSSFLAGLMANNIPYKVDSIAPFVKYINPASVITKTLKNIYFFENTSNYFTGILNLVLLIGAFIIVLLFTFRRRQHENI